MNLKKLEKYKTNIIIIIFLLVIIFYTYQFPRYGDINFIIKNISILSLFSFIVYIFTMRYYKKLLPRFNKKIFLQVYTLIFFGGFISLFSFAQIDVINTYLPSITECTYYDTFNNILYESHYESSCPEFTLVSEDNGLIHYSGFEITSDIVNTYHEEEMIQNVLLESKIIFDIYVKYKDNKIIEHTVLQTELTKFTNDEGIIKFAYISSRVEVVNTYDFYEFTTLNTRYRFDEEYDKSHNISIDTFTHKEFLEGDGKYDQYSLNYNRTDSDTHYYFVTREYQDRDYNIIEEDVGILERSVVNTLEKSYTNVYKYRASTDGWLQDTIIRLQVNNEESIITNVYYYHVDIDNGHGAIQLNYSDFNNQIIVDYQKSSYRLDQVYEYNSFVYEPSNNNNDDIYIEIGTKFNGLSKIKETSYGYMVINYSTYNLNNRINDYVTNHYTNLSYPDYLNYYQIFNGNLNYRSIVFPNNPILDFE